MSGDGQNPQPDQPKPDVDQLEAELEAKRRQLGETVDALGDKLDVPARTKQGISDARDRAVDAATDDDGRPTVQTYAVAAGVVALVVALVVWRRRRG